MNTQIESFMAQRRIAVVGASPAKPSFGYSAYCELKSRGFEVCAVNPKYAEIEGDKCVSSFHDLPPGTESALFVLSPLQAEQAVTEAAAAGIKRIWFQQGGKYDAAIRKAESLGLETVSKKCILMYAGQVTGIHAFHRWLNRLVGRY